MKFILAKKNKLRITFKKKIKPSCSLKQYQRGLTLVELMVAMTIGLFLLSAIGLVYMTSKTGFSYSNNTVRMSEDASFAIDIMSRDIRMAAYGGCAGISLARDDGVDDTLYTIDDVMDDPTLEASLSTPKLFSVTSLTDAFVAPNPFDSRPITSENAIKGFLGTDTESSTARTTLGIASSTSYTVSTTAPILYVAGGSEKALQVSAAVAAGTSSITFPGDPLKWSNDTTNTFRLIADCKGSEIFRSTSMTAAGVMTTDKVLINSYSADALVTPLISSAYFLATRKNGSASAKTPSLYRRYFNGVTENKEELVPNVEAIALQYGENTAVQTAGPQIGQPTFQADVYRAANAVTDWSRVVSIRMGFIMVSEDANLTLGAEPTITWIGGTYTPASTTDRRLRRAYSTTVSIRNRMGV